MAKMLRSTERRLHNKRNRRKKWAHIDIEQSATENSMSDVIPEAFGVTHESLRDPELHYEAVVPVHKELFPISLVAKMA